MNMNSGYIGWSMSRRAGEAYDNGLAPLSKIGAGRYVKAAAELIGPSEWHHTSKYCNRTDFYDVRRVRACAAHLKALKRDMAATHALRAERSRRRHAWTGETRYRRARGLLAAAQRARHEAALLWLRAEDPRYPGDQFWQLDGCAREWARAQRCEDAARTLMKG